MDITKRGIDMVAGANAALVYRKAHPLASEEEVMSHVMSFSKNKQFKNSQMEIVVGASYAMKLLARNPQVSDRVVIDQIMREMTTLLPVKE
jgi:hypothetical protein